jgi:hypothetical protein
LTLGLPRQLADQPALLLHGAVEGLAAAAAEQPLLCLTQALPRLEQLVDPLWIVAAHLVQRPGRERGLAQPLDLGRGGRVALAP